MGRTCSSSERSLEKRDHSVCSSAASSCFRASFAVFLSVLAALRDLLVALLHASKNKGGVAVMVRRIGSGTEE